MNRRNFLLAAPALALLPELIVPKRTIFLPPSCGWDGSIKPADLWAVVIGESTFHYSNDLADLLRNRYWYPHPIVKVRSKNERIKPFLYDNEDFYTKSEPLMTGMRPSRTHIREIHNHGLQLDRVTHEVEIPSEIIDR